MVLLTSSAISVAISSTVICIFTFLLFLSGYVLQQQTVRSLQEALHRPPEPKPLAVLPQKFWEVEEDIFKDDRQSADKRVVQIAQTLPQATEQHVLSSLLVQRPGGIEQPAQVLDTAKTDTPTTQTEKSLEVATLTISGPAPTPTQELRLAYVLAISSPGQICSALLFFKRQRQLGLQEPSLNLLYPSLWEMSSSEPAYKVALDLMREAQDTNHVVLHPVEISSVWAGITIENQLLAGLQRNWMRWGFDRSMYLRSPGLALDISKLDSALSKSSSQKMWVPLSDAPQDTPSVLLMSAEKSTILVPRGPMRGLIVDAKTGGHEQHHSKEIEIEAQLASNGAAYVVLEEEELEHRRGEKEWYGGVFERFERGRREVCAGTPFVTSASMEKLALRRGRGM